MARAPKVVPAATTRGIKDATEMPRTRASRTKAARTAMSSPRRRSVSEDRGDVVLKGRGPRHIGRGQS